MPLSLDALIVRETRRCWCCSLDFTYVVEDDYHGVIVPNYCRFCMEAEVSPACVARMHCAQHASSKVPCGCTEVAVEHAAIYYVGRANRFALEPDQRD